MKNKETKKAKEPMMIVTMYLPRHWNSRISEFATQKNRSRNEVYRDCVKFFIDIKDS